MPSYKLVYFNGRGRAEVSRLLFAQAGVEYEDSRVTQEEFAAMKEDKSKLPFGQLPVLIVDSHPPLPQSHAIERYLAREFGMYGKSNYESTMIDLVAETMEEIAKPVFPMYMEKDAEKKAQMIEEYVEKTSVPFITPVEKHLGKNNEGKGYFVGETMTAADLYVFAVFEFLEEMMPQLLDKYPLIKDFVARMKKEPKIAAWLEKRPKGMF
ncbi:S-crystallin SL11-like [Diadema setosum]|uniref:S-crystallin SL11-like n=1 Tax=Diadema setosum TaxID=31175 RepID=UPI003B3B9384